MTKNKIRYFKFLMHDHISPLMGFDYSRYLPKDGKPGPWLPKESRVVLCESGYHACQAKDADDWYYKELYEVELRGRIVGIRGDKVVAQQIRFLRRIKGWSELRFINFFESKKMSELLPTEYEQRVELYILNLADKSK